MATKHTKMGLERVDAAALRVYICVAHKPHTHFRLVDGPVSTVRARAVSHR